MVIIFQFLFILTNIHEDYKNCRARKGLKKLSALDGGKKIMVYHALLPIMISSVMNGGDWSS